MAHAHDTAAATTHVHGGPKLYGMVFGALLFLTVVTVAASYIHWGSGLMNVIIAMLIASMKGSLVVLFFMHLRWDRPVNAIIFCTTLFFLGLFLIGAYTDYVSRPHNLYPSNVKSFQIPGGQMLPSENTAAPVGQGSSNAPSIPGSSPQGSGGGAATGTTHPTPQVPAAAH